MKTLVAGLLAFAAAMMGSVTPAHAQSTRADSVMHFVETFLSTLVFSGEERPIVRLAALPAQVPAGLEIPAGVEIMGSVEFESLSYTLLKTPRPSEALATIRGTLEAGGWVLQPDDPSDTRFGAGPDPEPLTLCRDKLTVGLSSDEEDARISLFYMTDETMSVCTQPQHIQGEPHTSPIPPLRRPAGAQSRGGHGGGSGSEWYQSVTLATSLSLEELKSHYVNELQEHGAEIGSLAATEGAVVLTFQLPGADGEPLNGTLGLSGDHVRQVWYVHVYLAK